MQKIQKSNIRYYIVDIRDSSLSDRIRLKRTLESNNEVLYFSRHNINGLMLDRNWETDDKVGWDFVAFTGNKWDIVNYTFKPNISLNDFVEKFKNLVRGKNEIKNNLE